MRHFTSSAGSVDKFTAVLLPTDISIGQECRKISQGNSALAAAAFARARQSQSQSRAQSQTSTTPRSQTSTEREAALVGQQRQDEDDQRIAGLLEDGTKFSKKSAQ